MRRLPFSSPVSVLGVLWALGTSTAAAQQPPARPLPPPASAQAQFACVAPGTDEILAIGHGWRATFQGERLTFLPALGQAAPVTCPLSLELIGIDRGTDVWLRAAAAPAAVRTDRRTVTLDRGLVVERYEARPEGLEQTFTFGQRPPGTGDLVVRLRLATDLVPAPTGDGTLRWRRPGLGGVTIGAVTGIDARGLRTRGMLRHAGDELELSLPGWFVDAAAYPLVLDPLIGPAFEALPGYDSDFPDVAYEGWSDRFCIVWTQFSGGGVSDVVGSVWDGPGLTLQYAFAINQAGNEDSIRVGAVNGVGAFVLAWCNQAQANGPITISGMLLEPLQAQASQPFTIAGPGPVDAPVVSSEATAFDDDCLVIWQDAQYGICGSTVAVQQGLQPGLGPIVTIGGGSSATEPAISRSGGNPGLHVVTWVDRPVGYNGWVRAQVVDHDLNLLGPGVWLHNGSLDAASPALDGDGFLFLVAWEEQEAGNPSATDIRGRTFTVGPAGVTSLGPVQTLAGTAGRLDLAPDVALLGTKFGLCWQAGDPLPFRDDVRAAILQRSGAPAGGSFRIDLNGRAGYVYEHTPRLVGRVAGDATLTADDGLLVFGDQSITTFDSDIGVQAIESLGPGGPVQDLGGGCGPAGLAVLSGPFALGNDRLELQLFGADPLAIPFAAIGFPGPGLACGVCAMVTPVVFEFAPSTAGQAVKVVVLPSDPRFLGVTVELQWATFQNAYVGCPLAPGLAVSNRLRATLDW